MQISKLGDLRSLQLKRYSLDSINKHHLRNSRKSFISITQQSQNPSFYTPHFGSSNRLRIRDDSGNNGDDSSSTRKGWRRSLSSFCVDSGRRESWGSFDDDDGEEEVEVNKRGDNEVGSAGLGHERSKWGGGGGGGKVNPVRSRYEDPVLRKKKGKDKDKDRFSWVCSDCGHSDGQWWGTCRSCSGVNTMVKFSVGDYNGGGLNRPGGVDVVTRRTWLSQQHQSESHRPQRLSDVNGGVDQLKWRLPLCGGMFGAEVARVLGGGLVPGSLVLVGGDPGVGKSTLVLQIAAIISAKEPSSVVVYVSGEESIEQIGNRADRMGIGAEDIYLYSSTDIEDILEKIHPLSPRALIIDSIQTVYLKEVTGSAGGLSQVKECTSALLRFSKKTNIPVFLIGHVTKTGDIAGPRVLEHIVDVVLYMEGDKSSSHRLLRSVKNRFGSTDELGVFEMSQLGLQAVLNPSEIFLSEPHSESDFLPGLAVAVILDGSRSFLIEIQALCVSSGLTPAAIQVNGVEKSRAHMIICVLSKQAGLKIQENAAVFVNVVGGVSLKETAGDLAVAAAICSSVLEFPIPRGVAFIGEIGLGGELRTVTRMEKRLNTVAKLGYKKCIVPESALKSLAHLDFGGMHILGCKNLKEVIYTVFA